MFWGHSIQSPTIPGWVFGPWPPILKKKNNLLTHRRLSFFWFIFLSSYEIYYFFFFPGNSCSVWEQKERKWQVHSQQVINYFHWFCLVSFFHSALYSTLSFSILFWVIHICDILIIWTLWFLYLIPLYSVLTEDTLQCKLLFCRFCCWKYGAER